MESEKTLFKFPLTYVWSSANNCALTNEGGLIYIGSRNINHIGPVKNGKVAPDIDTLNTRQHLICVDVDPGWGKVNGADKTVEKYVAVLAQDRSVQLWNFANRKAAFGHKVHRSDVGNVADGHNTNQSSILMRFMKNRNVLSIDRTNIVNYCIASNTYYTFKNFLPKRVDIYTALECSPYNEEIFAIGTQKGSIYLCDLQKSSILYTLKGHTRPIISMKFTWHQRNEMAVKKVCQADERLDEELKVIEKKFTESKLSEESMSNMAAACDDFVDIYDFNYDVCEFGETVEEKNDKISDFVGIEKPIVTPEFDFKEACVNLKDDITVMHKGVDSQHHEMNEVSLEDCKNIGIRCPSSPSCSDNEEPLGSSLELIHNKNSNDGEILDDEIRHELECQADIHSTPLQDQNDDMIEAAEVAQEAMVLDLPNPSSQLQPSAQQGDSATNLLHETEEMETNFKIELSKDDPFLICERNENKDILLVSTCEDGKITLWHTGTGSHSDSLTLRSRSNVKNKIYPHVSWLNKSMLLATSRAGELFCFEMKAVHSLCEDSCYRLYMVKKNFKGVAVAQFVSGFDDVIWTMSTSRLIMLESFLNSKIVARFGCVSSSITCIAENPDDMNKIALSLADRRIGVLDISRLGPTEVPLENFNTSSDAQILSIAWSDDGKKLIYGTEEGKVAIINYGAQSHRRSPFVFQQLCGRDIYKVEWCNNEVFVLCNGSIAVYSDDMKRKNGFIIKGIQNVSTFTARTPFLFVGQKDGHLCLYRRQRASLDYDLIERIQIGIRYICNIAWSYVIPNQFAIVANCNTIAVAEFDSSLVKCNLIKKFMGSKEARSACTTVHWSYTNPKVFITCGQDGAIRIWNLDTCHLKAEYVRYFGYPLLNAIFLPSDENIVLCSGKSGTLEMFDIRDKVIQNKPKKFVDPIHNILWGSEAFKTQQMSSSDRRRVKRGKIPSRIYVLDASGESIEVIETPERERDTEDDKENKANVDEKQDPVETVGKQLQHLKVFGEPNDNSEDLNISLEGSGQYNKKHTSSILCLMTKELNKYPLEKTKIVLESLKNNGKGMDKILASKLFGSKDEAMSLIEEELHNHRMSASKGAQHLFLPQIGSTLQEEIKNATIKKRLNEWLVSLAPSISHQFWLVTVEAYSKQLEEQGFALQAACYRLAQHDQRSAIDTLIRGNMFKEAMLLGNIYLCSDDPLRQAIFEGWLHNLEGTGSFFAAALLLVLAEDYSRALQFLSRVFKKTPEIESIIAELKSIIKDKSELK